MSHNNKTEKTKCHETPTEGLDWSKPLVTIRCIAFNQEKYIREALEGFVMQETTFPFEAIVHDDASTDGTADIIREYAEKYPHIIKPIYQTENQYSKGKDGHMWKDITNAISSHSKYLAICEGDDFWNDTSKLQKQIDVLETHSDYSMCFCGSYVLSYDGKVTNLYNNLESRCYSGNEMVKDWIVATASVVYRKELQAKIPSSRRFLYGDILIILTCASNGKVYCISDKMATYRKGVGILSKFDKNNVKHQYKRIKHTIELLRYFPEFKDGIERVLFSTFTEFLRNKAVSKDRKKFIVKYIVKYYPFMFVKFSIKRSIEISKYYVYRKIHNK